MFTLVEQYQAASDKALQAFKELEQQEKKPPKTISSLKKAIGCK
ncbi:hypothetical protein QW180_02765 [Vibrio sinaloensis]|nr:hypothetical protein [Vibrio sinaloensis]